MRGSASGRRRRTTHRDQVEAPFSDWLREAYDLPDTSAVAPPAKRARLGRVIKSFRSADTRTLFETGKSRRFGSIITVATRTLTLLDAATTLEFLKSPPGNHLEALKGDRKGQHSIRINDQWRLCFRWTSAGPEDVEIADYH